MLKNWLNIVSIHLHTSIVRDVTATICSQCEADWIPDSIAEKLEALVEEARRKHRQVEVISLSSREIMDSPPW